MSDASKGCLTFHGLIILEASLFIGWGAFLIHLVSNYYR